MGDYIRGKKAYTKWDAESENIDIEYRPDSQKPLLEEGWLSGRKGKVIKVLLLILLFCMGIIVGFVIRRSVKEVSPFLHSSSSSEFPFTEMKAYAFSLETNDKLQNEIQADSIRNFLKYYATQPHIAGKSSNIDYVDYLVKLWQSWGIENVRVEKFTVLLSYPSNDKANKIRIIDTKQNRTPILIASEIGDDELHPDLRPYLAYSPNNSAQGKLVYANYGRKEDFDYLVSKNVSLNGSIVIMKMGNIHQANKVKFAEEHDAAGVLLYPDPADYVHERLTYPNGSGLPGDSVIRGSLNLLPGDPLQTTSDKASSLESWKLQLPAIPVQPISYNNALKFMSGMDGPEAPDEWVGGLDMKYHIGPGHISDDNSTFEVTMEVFNEMKETPIRNVIGNIKGKFEPDRYVIVGNHHDSWTNGSGDPGTGLAIFLEVVRAFSKLKESGWSPSRTLVFACWDAEEFGMIGSTEWLKLHEKELHSRAVAYINTDAAIEGRDNLRVIGSPLLQQAVSQSAHLVDYPYPDFIRRKGSLINHIVGSKEFVNFSNDTSVKTQRLMPLGSDSDYASFMGVHGISSVHLQFESQSSSSSYKLYHSAYDNFDAIEKFVDPGFNISRCLAQYLGTLAQLLSDSFVLPMNSEDYGKAILYSFKSFQVEYQSLLKAKKIYLDEMEHAVNSFLQTCKGFHNNFTAVNMDDEMLGYHEYNDRAMELERSLIITDWEVYRLAHRHAIYGAHPYNAKDGVAFPHLLGAVLHAKSIDTPASWKHVKYEIAQVISALNSARMVLSSDVLTNQGVAPSPLL